MFRRSSGWAGRAGAGWPARFTAPRGWVSLQTFRATVEHVEGAAVVGLLGELDMGAAPVLDEVIGRLISQGHCRLVVDLADLGFIDSMGLSALLTAQRRARAANGWMVVRSASPHLRTILQATRLDRELHLEDRDGRPVLAFAAREGTWT